jgi:hypothetical protein
MKNIFGVNLLTIVLFILVVIFLLDKCKKSDEENQIVNVDGKKFGLLKFKTDTIEKFVTKTVTVKGDDLAYEVYRTDTAIIIEERKIDTLTILRDYFAKNVYKDTLNFGDTLGYVFLIDTITQNKISERKWTSNIKQRTIKEVTIVKELPKNEFYVGVNANFDKVNYLNSIGAGLMLKDRNNKIYQLNGGISNNQTYFGTNLTPYFGGGVYWKIK